MSSYASRKRPPRAEHDESKTKTARANSPIVLEPMSTPRFETYEALALFRDMVWREAVKSGQYKLYVLALFLWAARIAGSSFDESGVKVPRRLFIVSHVPVAP